MATIASKPLRMPLIWHDIFALVTKPHLSTATLVSFCWLVFQKDYSDLGLLMS